MIRPLKSPPGVTSTIITGRVNSGDHEKPENHINAVFAFSLKVHSDGAISDERRKEHSLYSSWHNFNFSARFSGYKRWVEIIRGASSEFIRSALVVRDDFTFQTEPAPL